MRITIGKDIRIEAPTKVIEDWCERNLTLDNPDYIIANRLGRYVGRMEKRICLYSKDGDTLIVPFGCLSSIWKPQFIRGATYKTDFGPLRRNSLKGDINLYDYQERALKRLLEGKNGILEAPCGAGKTQIGLSLIKSIGGKALWLTHTKKLMSQSLERAKSCFDGDFGTITEGKVHIGRDITFATVQTMRALDPNVYENAFDTVIVDECHHCVGSPTKVMMFYKVLTNCNARYKFGLSATLERHDGLSKSVYAIIGPKLHTITKAEVGSKIIKAKHVPYNIPLEYPLESYCDSDGTLNYTKMITALSENGIRNRAIASNVHSLCMKRRKQLILCHRVAQVKELARLASAFCKVSEVTGSVRDGDRDYDADVIIATYALAKEGLDIPTLDVVHFATPLKDPSTVRQAAGRVERNYEGKPTPIVVDYVDEKIDYCVMCYRKRVNILKKS